LLIAPAAGGEPRQLYRGKEPLDDRLAWTADGKHVLVFRDRPEAEELWSFPTGGGPPETSVLHVGINGWPNCAVSPDGSRVAFVGNYGKEEIWGMNGLLGQKAAKP
jgi:hypothetical protein